MLKDVIHAQLDQVRDWLGFVALVVLLIAGATAAAGAEDVFTAVLTGQPPRTVSGFWGAIVLTCISMALGRFVGDLHDHEPEAWKEASGFSWWLVAPVAVIVLLQLMDVINYRHFVERVLPALFVTVSMYTVLVWWPASRFLKGERVDNKNGARIVRFARAKREPRRRLLLERRSGVQWYPWAASERPEEVEEKLHEFLADPEQSTATWRLRWVPLED